MASAPIVIKTDKEGNVVTVTVAGVEIENVQSINYSVDVSHNSYVLPRVELVIAMPLLGEDNA